MKKYYVRYINVEDNSIIWQSKSNNKEALINREYKETHFSDGNMSALYYFAKRESNFEN